MQRIQIFFDHRETAAVQSVTENSLPINQLTHTINSAVNRLIQKCLIKINCIGLDHEVLFSSYANNRFDLHKSSLVANMELLVIN